jgi:hypothetical protein
MIEIGIVIFSVLSTVISFHLIRKFERFEKAELTTYMLLFAWGAFLFGLSLTRLTDMAQLVAVVR